jgi:hypothetical protein
MTKKEKTGPKYEVGQHVKIYDADDKKVVNGVVTEVGDETIEIKWDDLTDPCEYEISNITLKGEYIIDHNT